MHSSSGTLTEVPEVEETHAPKYALWTGARASFLAFGFSFYNNERGRPETTGNFVGNGIAPEIDIGVRLSYRYTPYVFFERGFVGQGHRFEGSDATSSTDFFGLGFRYVSGDVNAAAFVTDLAVGKRVLRVSSGNQTYTMSGLEFFRLGVGAEVRLTSRLVLSPLASVSSGAFNDTDGDIAFACAPSCIDGVQRPTYTKGEVIRSSRSYVVINLGLGVHFDLLGK